MAQGRKIDQQFAVVCYAVAVCVSFVLSAIITAVVPTDGNLYIYLSYLCPQIGYIGIFLVNWKRYQGKISPLVEKKDVKAQDYLIGALIAVALLFFALLPNIGVTRLFEIMGVKASVIVPKMDLWYEYVLCGLTICVLPCIGEELVFRKAFCDGMSEVADYKTILLCGLAFSLSHLNPAQTIHQFFLGCVLALVYVKTKNVTVTMVMHFINNVIALYLDRITGAEIWNNITITGICMAVGGVALAVGLFLLLRKSKLNNEKTGKITSIMVILLVVLALAWGITFALSVL